MMEIITKRAAAAIAASPLEVEQSELRLVIVCAAGVFVFLSGQWPLLAFVLAGFLLSLAQLAWIALGKGADERRRSAAVLLDVVLVTAATLLAKEAGMVLSVLYLWIVTDNAVRFGRRYLHYAQVLALAAFAAVLVLRGFWSEHPALAATLVFVLIIAPRYLSLLVVRLHAASRFSAAADHDLRQPLHAISLYASILEERLGGADAPRLLLDLQLSLRLLEQHFELLLDCARLESGLAKPRVHAFALAPLFEQAAAGARGLAAHKNVELRFVPTAASVRSDPVLLGRLLAHLLTSAIRYGDRRRIVVGCRRAGPGRLRLEIVSSGGGAAAPMLELAVVQRLAALLNHAAARKPAAFSMELERAG